MPMDAPRNSELHKQPLKGFVFFWGIPILHLISVNKASMVREYTCQLYYDCSYNAAVLWPASL